MKVRFSDQRKCKIGLRNLHIAEIIEMAFVDDMVIVSRTERDLQNHAKSM